MGVAAYTLMTYGLTAVISYLVIGIIVLINRIISRPKRSGAANAEKEG